MKLQSSTSQVNFSKMDNIESLEKININKIIKQGTFGNLQINEQIDARAA